MENTKEFFKKIRGTKGTFNAKLGSIMDRSGMALTEVGLNNGQKWYGSNRSRRY